MGTSFDGLVEAENGLVSHRIFMEPEIYAQELERILARCFAVSVPRKPSPTAARLLYHLYGRDPVLVVRDSAGQVRAFLNSATSSAARKPC